MSNTVFTVFDYEHATLDKDIALTAVNELPDSLFNEMQIQVNGEEIL